jgi:lycopene beta-cyclase
MDACVEQHDGFRFVYVLPFARSVLIEETYFSDTPELDEPLLRARCLERLVRLGLPVQSRILRTERGALPLPLAWTPPLAGQKGPLLAGNRGGLFHPTTGYSFPMALRLAELIASLPLDRVLGSVALQSMLRAHHEQARFAVLLNRLLFHAARPENRRDVLERFHQLPPEVISRFYALQTTSPDRLRIVCGRPPRGLSLRRALREAVSA